MRTPILEHTGLFKRAIGEVTDIVEKEIVHLRRRAERRIVDVAPEGTASSVRAVIQHNLLYDGGKGCGTAARCFRTSARRGPLQAVSSGRRRGARFLPARRRRELIVDVRRPLARTRHRPTLQLNTGRPAARQRHRQKTIAYFEATRTRSTRMRSAACTAIAAHSRQQNPAMQGAQRCGAQE